MRTTLLIYRISIAILAFRFAVIPVAISGQQAVEDTARGEIGGTIFDRNTNRPVQGVRLQLTTIDRDEVTLHVTTDSAGAYRFDNITLGDYTLALARMGYHPLELDVFVNRSSPLIVSIGIIPVPVSLPPVTVHGQSEPVPVGTRGTPPTMNRRNTIDEAEIMERGMAGQDAYVILRRLRPSWLNQRSDSRIMGPENAIVLYVDNIRRGNIDDLRSIDAGMIARIHFFDALNATQEWGTGHVNGAISVILKPPAR